MKKSEHSVVTIIKINIIFALETKINVIEVVKFRVRFCFIL